MNITSLLNKPIVENSLLSNSINGGKPVPSDWLPSGFNELINLVPDLNLQANNPVEYVYKMLENSGLYPDATWNVNQ